MQIEEKKNRVDFTQTLNLPKTDFPMRANLAQREPEIQRFWKERNIYSKLMEKNAGKPRFILHDGPPYSNGDIHIGHALNKVLKDVIVKFKAMSGHYAPYVPGWDNHGLPTERLVMEKWFEEGKIKSGTRLTLKEKLALRKECRKVAAYYSQLQSQQFQRLGVFGDWQHPYMTMDYEFEAKIVEAFGELALRGYIYRGLKTVYWCKSCTTALAEAEVEYAERESPSMWVRFRVRDDPVGAFEGLPKERSYAIIWTTTPWTIPGNMAICLHPQLDYVIVEVGNAQAPNPKSKTQNLKPKTQTGSDYYYYLLAEGLLFVVADALGWDSPKVINRFVGEQLRGLVFTHPLYDLPSPIILGEHVTLEQGTGCVHTAPGHGPEDFDVCQKEGIPIICPVDEFGKFTEQAGERLIGVDVEVGNEKVVEWLQEVGALMKLESVRHSYPHCWRCKEALLFRAAVQWFMNVDHNGHRQRCLEEIKRVRWVPAEGMGRITAMVENRPDWCLSRQRAWGVGLPIFYCNGCGGEVVTKESIQAVVKITRREGSDVWFEKSANEILPEGFSCPHCGGKEFVKEEDVLDVWFDSGSTHLAVCEPRPELGWPADMYLEGSDQHRGWFNSSLMVAVGTRGEAPYRIVLTHGFVVDEEGRAMHKSVGNVISPFQVIDEWGYGADLLRLWACSSSYFSDVRIGRSILGTIKRGKQTGLAGSYFQIRNTLRFCLSNLYDFEPDAHRVSYEQMPDIHRYILHRLQKTLSKVTEHFEDFEFYRAFQTLLNFCINELSSFYLDINKDTLYCSASSSAKRRCVQTVLFELANALCRVLFPMLSHTAEDAWQHLPDWSGKPESVALTDWPFHNPALMDDELEFRFERLLMVRDDVNRALEQAKKEERVENPLEAEVTLYAPRELVEFLRSFDTPLYTLFITSKVAVEDLDEEVPAEAIRSEEFPNLWVRVNLAPSPKCPRCWMRLESVGEDTEYPELCDRCVSVVRGK